MTPGRTQRIVEGVQYGQYLALGSSAALKSRVPCRCVHCGREYDLLARTLLGIAGEYERSGHMRRCKLCNTGGAAKARPARCSRCEGLAHRRPRVGLCKCGEAFRELPPLEYDFGASRGGVGQVLAGGTIHA